MNKLEKEVMKKFVYYLSHLHPQFLHCFKINIHHTITVHIKIVNPLAATPCNS